MPNRTEAATRKPRQLATGRLQPLRLFSTPPTRSMRADERRNAGMPWTGNPDSGTTRYYFRLGMQLLEAARLKNQCSTTIRFEFFQSTSKHSRALASGTVDAPKRYSDTTKRRDEDWFRRRIGVHGPRSKSKCRNAPGSGLLPDGSSSFGYLSTTRCELT
jgi:hypothetical protein